MLWSRALTLVCEVALSHIQLLQNMGARQVRGPKWSSYLARRCTPLAKNAIFVTLGHHTPEPYIGCPYPCPPMPMGFGWACIGFVHPCIQLQIGVKLLGCREYANQEVLRVEANNSERPFICPIQPRLGVCG